VTAEQLPIADVQFPGWMVAESLPEKEARGPSVFAPDPQKPWSLTTFGFTYSTGMAKVEGEPEPFSVIVPLTV